MTEPETHERSAVDGCAHQFCFECIAQWGDHENTCPLCKARFTKITRCHPQAKNAHGETINSKVVENKDQRSDVFPGQVLGGLLARIAARGGGVRSLHADGFEGHIVFPSDFRGFGSMLALGAEDRRMFGGPDSDDDEDGSDFPFGEISFVAASMQGRTPREVTARASLQAARASVEAARASLQEATATLRPMVRMRSSRARTFPAPPSAGSAVFVTRTTERRTPRMSIPSMINVQRSTSVASSNRGAIGTSATRPLEIDDDSDDDVVVVELARAT